MLAACWAAPGRARPQAAWPGAAPPLSLAFSLCPRRGAPSCASETCENRTWFESFGPPGTPHTVPEHYPTPPKPVPPLSGGPTPVFRRLRGLLWGRLLHLRWNARPAPKRGAVVCCAVLCPPVHPPPCRCQSSLRFSSDFWSVTGRRISNHAALCFARAAGAGWRPPPPPRASLGAPVPGI